MKKRRRKGKGDYRWEALPCCTSDSSQEDPILGRKNTSGQPYDIVGLGYHDTEVGTLLSAAVPQAYIRRGDGYAIMMSLSNGEESFERIIWPLGIISGEFLLAALATTL